MHQGQLFRAAGRETSFVPTYRIVADMASDGLETTLQGGPSDRRFSRWYCSDLDDWLHGNYKRLVPEAPRPLGL